MPEVFGYTGLDAIIVWVVLIAAAVWFIVSIAVLIALLVHASNIRLAVEHLRWLADDGPAREEAAQMQSTATVPPAGPSAPVPPAGTLSPAAPQQFVPESSVA